MNYKFFTQKSPGTPQSQPIPGREAEMIRGRSGGFMFDAGIWQMLRRCLLIGTAKSTFYAGKRELTEDFVNVVQQAIAIDPARVAQEILYASDGRAINNSAPILALVLLSMGEDTAAKTAFSEIFPQVVRTGSHFYEWLSYTKSLRGFGKIVREAGKSWLSRADVKGLAYQLLKYQFYQAGFLTYEHQAAPVDFVVTKAALHHLPDFWKQVALLRIAAMLKSGGVLYLRDAIFSFPPHEYQSHIDNWIQRAAKPSGEGFTVSDFEMHVREEYSTFAWMIEGMLDRTGFEFESNYLSPTITEYICRKR